MPARKVPTQDKALVAESLSHDELMAMLGQTGAIATGGGGFRRMSLRAGMLVTDPGTPDEEKWPPTKSGPVMIVRIVRPPRYYNSFFMDETEKNGSIDARKIGRPDLNGKFAKKYDDPQDQAEDQYANLDAYEALAAHTGTRGSFKADIDLQIVPESGELTGDEPIYTLSLSTTSALDWRGTSQNPGAGVVQEQNFIVQLSGFAAAQAAAAGKSKDDQRRAVLDALEALRLGNVFAGLYLVLTQSDKDASMSWWVVAFKPVHIADAEEQAALTEGEAQAASSTSVPF